MAMCEAKTGTERDIPGKTENKNKQKTVEFRKDLATVYIMLKLILKSCQLVQWL